MKQLLTLALSLIGYNASHAQIQRTLDGRLSPATHLFLQNEAASQRYGGSYVYKVLEGDTCVSALMLVNERMQEEALRPMRVRIGTKAGKVWTMNIPIHLLREVTALKGFDYFMVDEPVHPMMDSARRKTNTDSVYNSSSLWGQYIDGKNVVVGILDVGFDYTHPSFYDTAMQRLRIRSVWEQQGSGTPPPGYTYGAAYLDSAGIVTRQTDNAQQSHGSHVAGIAAGSGFVNGNNVQFRGMAPGADIVMVGITPPSTQWTSTGMSDIIDGANYVYQYAAAQGKAAVVNLSWGCTIGSHDGRSLFSQAMDNLVGASKIFALSAGNNGSNNIHLQKTFSATTTDTVHTFINFPTSLSPKSTWVDMWGDSSQQFYAQIFLFDDATNQKVDSTGYVPSALALNTFYLKNTVGDTCTVTLSSHNMMPFNNKPRILADITNKTSLRVGLSLYASNQTVDAWMGKVVSSTGYYGSFTNAGKAWAVNGDKKKTIGDMATTKRALTVGAFASKNNVNWPNTQNAIASFSSLGPTQDGRIKPDITAPGLVITSAFNSADANFKPGGAYAALLVKTVPLGTQTYYYGVLAGTSMSSPVASGAVALMLQANKFLTPEKIKDILSTTALIDNYTTASVPNNTWGSGKLNVMAAVRKAYAMASNITTPKATDYALKLYPNPCREVLFIESGSPLVAPSISLYNIFGTCVLTQPATQLDTHTLLLPTTQLSSGHYFIEINDESGRRKVCHLVKE